MLNVTNIKNNCLKKVKYMFYRKRIFIYSLFILSTFQNSYTQENNEKEYSDIITHAHETITTLQDHLIHYATLVSNGQISSIKQPSQTNKNIQGLVELTNELLGQKIDETTLTADITYQFVSIINKMIKHTLLHVANDSKRFEPFVMVTTDAPETVTFEMIKTVALENTLLLEKINNSIAMAGIKWYNKLYRKFDALVIHPCTKYKIPYIIFGSGSCALFSLLLWRSMNEKHFLSSPLLPNFIKHTMLGEQPRSTTISTRDLPSIASAAIMQDHNNQESGFQTTIANRDKLGWWGTWEMFSKNMMTAGTMASGAFFMVKDYAQTFVQAGITTIRPKISNTIAIYHNKLLGGQFIAYAKKIDKTDVEKVEFDNLIGMDEVKMHFREILIPYIKNPEASNRRGLVPSKGYLLYGPSRSGKSYAVKALMDEIQAATNSSDYKFVSISASEINTLGMKQIHHLIESFAPCILFIDELDLIGLCRDGKNQTLSEFLVMMSGSLEKNDPKKQVIIIGATNQPETIDSALKQHGRFGCLLLCRLPDVKDRKKAFEIELSKRSYDLRLFNIERLAQETEGQSFQSITSLINRGILAAQLKGQRFGQRHIEHAIDEQVRQILFTYKPLMSPSQEHLLATYFGGMALALELLNSDLKVATVTTHPVKKPMRDEWMGAQYLNKELQNYERYYEYGKIFTYKETDNVDVATYEDRIKKCIYLMSGIAAEELVFGVSSYSCGKSNIDEALTIAYKIVSQGFDLNVLNTGKASTSLGQSSVSSFNGVQEEWFKQAHTLLLECKQKAYDILKEHTSELNTITERLKARKILSGEQIKKITRPKDSQNLLGVGDGGHTPKQNESITIVPQEKAVSSEPATGHHEKQNQTDSSNEKNK